MILFLLLFICSILVGLFLPWWVLIPVAYFLCIGFSKNLKVAFIIPFVSIYILWLSLNLYYSVENQHVLARKVAELFELGDSPISWLWLVLLGPLPGAISASLAGASGYLTKQVLFKK